METLSIILLVLSIVLGFTLSFIGGYFLGKCKGRDEVIKRIERRIMRAGPDIDN